MAGYKYFVILTDIGKQKLAQAIATESPLDFTEMAVGDSNGTSYNPTPDMTALKHETYRATISNVSIDEVDKNIMIFQLVVPSSSGGYYIREAGLFSSDGSLIAIARTAEQYKPQLSEGAGASIDINMRIAISSEAQIYINVPESDSYATHKYVAEEFKKHTQEEDPHQQYMLETYANEIFATKESLTGGLDAKADKNHNHNEVYSIINHSHEDVYSDINHNHDEMYIKKGESSGAFAPLPTQEMGLGQIFKGSSNAGTDWDAEVTLPKGGTWLVFDSGIFPGGYTFSSVKNLSIVAWRIK